MSMYVCICVCIYTETLTLMFPIASMHIFMYGMDSYMSVYTYIYTYIHVHTYIQYTQRSLQGCISTDTPAKLATKLRLVLALELGEWTWLHKRTGHHLVLPSGSKYPTFKNSGPKSHSGYGFWDQSP